MNRSRRIAVAAGFALLGFSLAVRAADTGWSYPAIPGYGGMQPLPKAAVQPDKSATYKAVFDVTSGAQNPATPNPGLEHVARAVNVFASAGVPLSHLKFVAVIHGPHATPIVLDDEHYRARFGTDNPNVALIAALEKAGVEVEVCGQALAELEYEHAWVNKDVVITLSALSDLVIYGNQGYAFVKQ